MYLSYSWLFLGRPWVIDQLDLIILFIFQQCMLRGIAWCNSKFLGLSSRMWIGFLKVVILFRWDHNEWDPNQLDQLHLYVTAMFFAKMRYNFYTHFNTYVGSTEVVVQFSSNNIYSERVILTQLGCQHQSKGKRKVRKHKIHRRGFWYLPFGSLAWVA